MPVKYPEIDAGSAQNEKGELVWLRFCGWQKTQLWYIY